jgi:hypothetical protein
MFPLLPDRAGFYKRREAPIEALIAEFAARSPASQRSSTAQSAVGREVRDAWASVS